MSYPPANAEVPRPVTPVGPEVRLPAGAEHGERLARLLQFPRRVVLLLLAFGLLWLLLLVLRGSLASIPLSERYPQASWDISLLMGQPVADMVLRYLPNTLLLVGAALALSLLGSLAAALIAVLVHKLEQYVGPLGSALKGLGRALAFALGAAPPAALALLLLLIFAIQLGWLPLGGLQAPGRSSADLGDVLRHLLLPALTLALLPKLLTGQAAARELTLPRLQDGGRVWLAGLCRWLGTAFGQVGGLLSAAVVVEAVFSWPGLGGLLFTAVINRDYPLLFGTPLALAAIVLVGRLLAELFRWLERLLHPAPLAEPQPVPWRRLARTIYVVTALVLLLLPLGLTVAGLTVDSRAVEQMSGADRNKGPSAEHPWGADYFGRDVQARTLNGSLVSLGTAALVAAVVLLPALAGGALSGFLAARRSLWAESLADLLLLPADVLGLLPALPAALLLISWAGLRQGAEGLALSVLTWLVTALVLLPRAVRAAQTLWLGAPVRRRWLTLGLFGSGALFLGTLFAAFGLGIGLDFMVFAARPTPSLGNLLAGELLYGTFLLLLPSAWIIAGLTCACAFALYTAADALIGYFTDKGVMGRLNE
jgi:ABC-type dipeptide/oligopeptide/nickel transport system permease subunit